MKVFTDYHVPWLEWIAPERFNNEELFRIVIFFVFHSPCPELSSRGKLLPEYNWPTPWRKPFYLNRHLKRASSNQKLLFSAATYDKMDDALEKANLLTAFPSDFSTERICIYDNMHNQFLSVFYHLRNAFAHCRLNMVDINGECVFVLEDIIKETRNGTNTYKVTARMILRKSTLLRWIELIEAGEKPYIKDK